MKVNVTMTNLWVLTNIKNMMKEVMVIMLLTPKEIQQLKVVLLLLYYAEKSGNATVEILIMCIILQS